MVCIVQRGGNPREVRSRGQGCGVKVEGQVAQGKERKDMGRFRGAFTEALPVNHLVTALIGPGIARMELRNHTPIVREQDMCRALVMLE